MPNLANIINLVRVMASQAAGITTITGTHVDMSGFDGVLFIALYGALTATQVTQLKAQGGNAVGDGDQADLAGSSGAGSVANAPAGLPGGEIFVPTGTPNSAQMLDIYRPNFRYVRPVIVRGTANAAIDGCLALQYQADGNVSSGLWTIDASVIAKLVLASPLAGTA